jgi:hypothetical protein
LGSANGVEDAGQVKFFLRVVAEVEGGRAEGFKAGSTAVSRDQAISFGVVGTKELKEAFIAFFDWFKIPMVVRAEGVRAE